MPKASRYVTRASKRRSSSPVKKATESQFVDDEAQESDDGVVIDKRDLEREGDSDAYEADFIDDREMREDGVFGTPDLTPPPAEQSSKVTPLPAAQVIDVESSDEDMEIMATDDSMFRRPTGLKATALPPALVTRSKRTGADITSSAGDSPSKKARKHGLDASNGRHSSVEIAITPAPFDPAVMFMAGWMEEFMAKQAAKKIQVTPPAKPQRIDFDQLELARGLAASSADKIARSTRSAKAKVIAARESPVWDIEESPNNPPPRDVKGKGKATSAVLRDAAKSAEDVFHAALPDEGLKDVVDKARDASRSQLSSFVIKTRKGNSTEKALRSALADESITMSKFFRDHTSVLVESDSDSRSSSISNDRDPPSTAFLEDLETYKSFFDPDAPCGVFDADLQDPALAATYRKLPPLPAGRQILPAYDPSRLSGGSSEPDTKGGRAKFSSWKGHIKNMLARLVNCIGAVLFVDCGPNFINPSRVSPVRLSGQLASGSSGTQRLMFDNKIAVCVSAVFCTDSVVVTAGKIGGKSERLRKWVSGIFHNQDWERFESLMCLVFGRDLLYAQINSKKAISFQSMISPESVSGSKGAFHVDTRFDKNAPSDMFSPIVPKKATPARPKPRPIGTPSKTLLAYDEHLPVYDARKTAFNFEFDLPRISTLLPPYTGEIPFSSFIVVGYTASSYTGSLGGSTERVAHLGCNVIWVMVCGTPTLRR
ncbi:hypothetical protein B0H16DRAFT_1717900 [Mycena metata]|uniref:Uncharacterized protein n=1 Tax=Mycena metata TaxID=1033252 RepID=A0AAD7NL46_9AGAR|nr:hypothetical protein B0H16DRAFT_1717900 [Mycena metata]